MASEPVPNAAKAEPATARHRRPGATADAATCKLALPRQVTAGRAEPGRARPTPAGRAERARSALPCRGRGLRVAQRRWRQQCSVIASEAAAISEHPPVTAACLTPRLLHAPLVASTCHGVHTASLFSPSPCLSSPGARDVANIPSRQPAAAVAYPDSHAHANRMTSFPRTAVWASPSGRTT